MGERGSFCVIVDGCRWVIGRQDVSSLNLPYPPTERTHGLVLRMLAEHVVGREGAETDDDVGVDGLYLRIEMWRARGNLLRFWVSVLRRSAFQHVGDVDISHVDVRGGEHV